MSCRIVTAVLALLLAVQGALAADLPAEPLKRKNFFGRCSTFNNLWIYGDPRDCPGDETVPACDAAEVVSAAVRFANRAEPVYRVPRVTEFLPIRELPDPVYNPSPLVRRYCEASVVLDTGHRTTAYYFLEEDSGFVAIPWAVYVCIEGYDAWRVYDGRCRIARPAPTQ